MYFTHKGKNKKKKCNTIMQHFWDHNLYTQQTNDKVHGYVIYPKKSG